MTRAPHRATFGAICTGGGVRFCVWASAATSVQLHLHEAGGQVRVSHLARLGATPHDAAAACAEACLWQLTVPDARAGDRYAYSIDGREPQPDPASRFQPDGVHGWSEVVDPHAFQWTDAAWNGLDPRRAVIYELHVGAFSPEGTFQGIAAKLPYLRDLGVTAIELMPVAEFAGSRNWGYDGVALFAPSRAYGRPDDLRALVDAAHGAGLAVVLDVVYNHLGPEGAYLPAMSPQFLTARHATPWGHAVNLDDEGSGTVRAFLVDNATHWIDEYHMDGLRLDATHALIDARSRHFVAELTARVHAATHPPPLVYAEDHRNLNTIVEDPSRGGWGLDGVWADDFHHVVRRMLAGDRHAYYADYEGAAPELAATLRNGWLYTGQPSRHEGAARGTDPSGIAMRKAIICVQNHDQVGNRALGDRLHHVADPAAWRAAVTVLLMAPMTPLLFMGQEWGTDAPFQFFTDFEPELGRRVVEGRRREFHAFPGFSTDEGARRLPDPQSVRTFEVSRLRWEEHDEPGHAGVLALHRALLRLRGASAHLHGSDACDCAAEALDNDTVAFRRDGSDVEAVLVVARLRGSGRVTVPSVKGAAYRDLLDTESPAFAADPRPPIVDRTNGVIEFARAGALVFSGLRS